MTRVRYTGPHPGTLGDYIDLGTGRALTVEPGKVYDVAPASGRAVPEVPGHCVAVGGGDRRPTRLKPAAEPEAESAKDAESSEEEDEPEPAEDAG